MSERYYVAYLSSELERRKKKNPRYSLRAFAQALQVDPSALSRILSGKQELSLQACLKLVKQLGMTAEEKKQFVASVAQGKMDHATRVLVQAIELPSDFSNHSRNAQKLDGLEFFKEVMLRSPDLVYLFARGGECLFMNDSGARAAGVSGPRSEAATHPDEIIELVRKEIDKVFESGKHHCGMLSTSVTPHRHFEFILTPIFQAEIEIRAVLTHIREMTHIRPGE